MKYLSTLIILLFWVSSCFSQDTTFYGKDHPLSKANNKNIIKEISVFKKKDNSQKTITGYYPTGEIKYVYERQLIRGSYMPNGIDKQYYKNGEVKSVAKYEPTISYPPIYFKRFTNKGELYKYTKSSKIKSTGKRKNTISIH